MSVNAEKTYPEVNVQDRRKDGNTDNERAAKTRGNSKINGWTDRDSKGLTNT